MTAKVTFFVVASVLLVCVAALEPIWLSPTDTAIETLEDVTTQFTTKGAWVNNTHGAGGRAFAPLSLMDSKGTLWILGGEDWDAETVAFHFAVWNYDPKTDLYRWVAGPSNRETNPRNPGELRIPSDNAHPGGLIYTCATIDHDDNIWFMNQEYKGELWRFNTTSWQFTRMQGLNDDQTYIPVPGEQGVPSDDVFPGHTEAACFVTDSQNNLWLISGYNHNGMTDTVWRYNIATMQWTFIYGNASALVTSSYGSTPVYGGKWGVSCDIDADDVVWLFGGWGTNPLEDYTYNDVWTFDTTSETYTLQYGSVDSYRATPVVVSDDFHPDNHPGCKEFVGFIDQRDGTLLMAGGGGNDPTGDWDGMNDAWLFNKTNKQWKLLYGIVNGTDINSTYTHYRTAGSVMGDRYYAGIPNGRNTKGDVFIVGGIGRTNYFFKDIWLLPNDQCTTGSHQCDPGATCIEQVVGSTCDCPEGYTLAGTTCMDIDECNDNTDDCKDGEDCVNTDGSYNCTPIASAPLIAPQGQVSSSAIVSINVLAMLSLALLVWF